MKQIILLSLLVFSLGISATVSGSGLYANPMPIDTLDYLLIAKRTQTDSIIYTWIGNNKREGLILREENGIWADYAKEEKTYNDEYKVLSKTYSVVKDGQCCQPEHCSIYEYNENNLPTLYLYQKYKNGQWVDTTRTTYEYIGTNIYNLANLELKEVVIDDEWINIKKSIVELDEQDRITYRSIEFWENDTWNIGLKVINVYDENDNLIFYEQRNSSGYNTRFENEFNEYKQKISSQYYSYINEEWIPSSIFTYSYNELGQLLTTLNLRPENSYTPSTLKTHYYDSIGNEVQSITQFLEEDSIFVFKTLSTYDEYNNENSNTSQRWEEDAWNNYRKRTYEYDEFGRELHFSFAEWSDSLTRWIISGEDTNNYDEFGNKSLSEYLSYSILDGSLYSGVRYNREYYEDINLEGNHSLKSYSTNTFTLEEGWETLSYGMLYYQIIPNGNSILIDNSLTIFPNPTEGILNINLDDAFLFDVLLELYSMNGQLMYTQAIPSGFNPSIQLPNIPQRMYVVKLSDGEHQSSSLLQVK